MASLYDKWNAGLVRLPTSQIASFVHWNPSRRTRFEFLTILLLLHRDFVVLPNTVHRDIERGLAPGTLLPLTVCRNLGVGRTLDHQVGGIVDLLCDLEGIEISVEIDDLDARNVDCLLDCGERDQEDLH